MKFIWKLLFLFELSISVQCISVNSKNKRFLVGEIFSKLGIFTGVGTSWISGKGSGVGTFNGRGSGDLTGTVSGMFNGVPASGHVIGSGTFDGAFKGSFTGSFTGHFKGAGSFTQATAGAQMIPTVHPTTMAPTQTSMMSSTCLNDARIKCDPSTCSGLLKNFCPLTCGLCVPTTATTHCVDSNLVNCIDPSVCSNPTLQSFCPVSCGLCNSQGKATTAWLHIPG